MIKFLDLNKQYSFIKDEIDASIAAVIKDSAFVGGKYVSEFEKNFSAYQEAEYCVAVGNGTDALEIAIESLKLPSQSEIIVPANSFVASAEAVTRAGHRVKFCDCREDDYTIDLEDVKNKITRNTSAVMAVHLYGHPCDMDGLKSLCREHELMLIEDCAQAHGAEYKGNKVGSIGDIGAFSFYPGKNLGAYGDGGAIVTNNERYARKCRMIANHGRELKFDHEIEGRNSRLDGMQAAILNVKLKYLEEWTNHRIELADIYLKELRDVSEITLPIRQEYVRNVYHLFVIRLPSRDKLRTDLQSSGVQTGVHYPVALPKLNAYGYLKQGEDNKIANQFGSQLLSLPIGDHLSFEDVKKVSQLIRELA